MTCLPELVLHLPHHKLPLFKYLMMPRRISIFRIFNVAPPCAMPHVIARPAAFPAVKIRVERYSFPTY